MTGIFLIAEQTVNADTAPTYGQSRAAAAVTAAAVPQASAATDTTPAGDQPGRSVSCSSSNKVSINKYPVLVLSPLNPWEKMCAAISDFIVNVT